MSMTKTLFTNIILIDSYTQRLQDFTFSSLLCSNNCIISFLDGSEVKKVGINEGYLFLRMTGRMLRNAKMTNNAIDWKVSASVVDVSCWRVVPA